MLAQATQTSPWWGVPVVAGFFAIFGVVVSQLVSYQNEKRKDKRRLETDVRAACARFLAAQREAVNAGIGAGAMSELILSSAELELVAPRRVCQRSMRLLRATFAVLGLDPSDESSEPDEVRQRAHELRYELVNELREWLDLEPLEI